MSRRPPRAETQQAQTSTNPRNNQRGYTRSCSVARISKHWAQWLFF